MYNNVKDRSGRWELRLQPQADNEDTWDKKVQVAAVTGITLGTFRNWAQESCPCPCPNLLCLHAEPLSAPVPWRVQQGKKMNSLSKRYF